MAHHNVFKLNVAVQDPNSMKIPQSLRELEHYSSDVSFVQLDIIRVLIKIVPLHVL